jgi:hypothetical protein
MLLTLAVLGASTVSEKLNSGGVHEHLMIATTPEQLQRSDLYKFSMNSTELAAFHCSKYLPH